jgi:uncharacterized membrane protein
MEFIYRFLEQLGYAHPLHPAVTHLPTGLVAGAFIFLLVAIISGRHNLLTTAHHCMILALIFLFPTALFGFTDWLHFYAGAWTLAIQTKIVLTGALLIFLAGAVIMEIKKIGGIMGKFFVYFLCLISVVGTGYFGGSLVFPGKSHASADPLRDGEKLYATHCAGCHPKGGNVINPALPIVGSPQLNDLNAFTKFNRNPLKPDGSKGTMPAFPKEKISDQEMDLIYQYVTKSLVGKQSP